MATTDFEPLEDARVRTVKVRGDRGSVTYELPDDPGPDGRLLAIKEDGRWGLVGDESVELPSAEGSDEQRPPAVEGPPCPSGTPLVRAGDLVDGLPPGYELADAAGEPPVVDVLRVAMGRRLRRIETKVLIRGRSEAGTGVIVLNSRRRQSEQDSVAEMVAGARAAGAARPERIDIAGGEGVLIASPNNVFAIAPVAPCAAVMLTDDDEARLRRAAGHIRSP